MMTNGASYRAFGLYRFGLALMVVAQHFQYLLPNSQRGFFQAMGLGETAVALFFLISGFIIAEANACFYSGRPGAFILNRLLRIVPPFWAALILAIVVHGGLASVGHLQLWDYTYTARLFTARTLALNLVSFLPGFHLGGFDDFEFIAFVWSLRIEISFYILAALLSLLAFGMPPVRRVWLVWAIAIGGTALFAVSVAGRLPAALCHVPFFLAGGAMFLSAQRGDKARGLATSAAMALAMLAFWHWPDRALSQRLPAPMLAVFTTLALLAWYLSRLSPASGTIARRIDRLAGDLCYPVYLNHYVVGIALYNLIPLRGWWIWLLGACLSLLLAMLMYHLVERPLANLRTSIRGVSISEDSYKNVSSGDQFCEPMVSANHE